MGSNIDYDEIYRRLAVPEPYYTVWIKSFKWVYWGKTWIFECIYDVLNPKTFQLIFEGCRHMNWDLDIEDDNTSDDRSAVVIGMTLGKENYEQSACITTELVEIILLYRNLTIVKTGEW